MFENCFSHGRHAPHSKVQRSCHKLSISMVKSIISQTASQCLPESHIELKLTAMRASERLVGNSWGKGYICVTVFLISHLACYLVEVLLST